MAKKTVKELNKDVLHLMESFEEFKSDFDNRISALKIEHEDKIKSLEAKIATLEKAEQPSLNETASNTSMKCRDCEIGFVTKSDLKIHILAVHPK